MFLYTKYKISQSICLFLKNTMYNVVNTKFNHSTSLTTHRIFQSHPDLFELLSQLQQVYLEARKHLLKVPTWKEIKPNKLSSKVNKAYNNMSTNRSTRTNSNCRIVGIMSSKPQLVTLSFISRELK